MSYWLTIMYKRGRTETTPINSSRRDFAYWKATQYIDKLPEDDRKKIKEAYISDDLTWLTPKDNVALEEFYIDKNGSEWTVTRIRKDYVEFLCLDKKSEFFKKTKRVSWEETNLLLQSSNRKLWSSGNVPRYEAYKFQNEIDEEEEEKAAWAAAEAAREAWEAEREARYRDTDE